MRISFRRQAKGECISTVYRIDGTVWELPSFSRKWRVPHDIAHAVTERELGLAGGVFGLIASGAVFPNMRVIAGKPRHDAKARSERVMKAYGGSITTAEVMAGVLHHTVELRLPGTPMAKAIEDWGIVEQRPFPWSEADLTRATDVLRAIASQWESVPVDGELDFLWPDSLTHPVPPSRR